MWRIVIILLLSLLLPAGRYASAVPVSPIEYGLHFTPDKNQIDQWTKAKIDSTLKLDGQQAQGQQIIYQVAKDRQMEDRTLDFYFLLSLCLLLGLLRFTAPHYFSILLRSFRNPSGSRHFKEQIQGAALTNFLMNVFFSVIVGTYIYYAGRVFAFNFSRSFDGPLMLVFLIGGILAIYLGKYFVIRFSGWAFRVETITEQYLFNVFLINKIIGIVLLPFVILLAFCDRNWASSLVIVSVLLTALLIFNRYTRSWNVFGSFFQYSRFHFFTYLCASEILPMAILLKLLLRTMA